MTRNDLAVNTDGAYKRGDDKCYYLRASMDIDYKVTKKITDTSMADAWVKSNIDRGTFR